MTALPKILVIGSPIGLIPEDLWTSFSSRYDVLLYDFSTTRSFHEGLQTGPCSDIVAIVRLGLNIPAGAAKVGQGWTKAALPFLPPSLKAIVNFGHGYDEEDIPGLDARGIRFFHTTGGTEVTATIGIYLIIAAFRQVSRYERMLRDGEFLPALRDSAKHAVDPHGKSVAIIGMGSIGQAVARLVAALGMRVHCVKRPSLQHLIDESENEHQGGGSLPILTLHDDINSLVAKVDCVVLTCSYTPSTHHLVDEELLERMKPGVRIVNIARGKCIDEEALCHAIENGKVGGVGLDVHYNEYVSLFSSAQNHDLGCAIRRMPYDLNAARLANMISKTPSQPKATLVRLRHSSASRWWTH